MAFPTCLARHFRIAAALVFFPALFVAGVATPTSAQQTVSFSTYVQVQERQAGLLPAPLDSVSAGQSIDLAIQVRNLVAPVGSSIVYEFTVLRDGATIFPHISSDTVVQNPLDPNYPAIADYAFPNVGVYTFSGKVAVAGVSQTADVSLLVGTAAAPAPPAKPFTLPASGPVSKCSMKTVTKLVKGKKVRAKVRQCTTRYRLVGELTAPDCAGGYDIEGAQVTVRDEKNAVIGTATTSQDVSDTAAHCTVYFRDGLPKAKFYQVTIGTHGAPIYTFSQLTARHWRIFLVLGQ